MFTKIKLALIGSAMLVGGVAAAHGTGGGPDKAALLQKYDVNKDGKLDDAERATMKADFAAKRAARKQENLAKYDTNKDGKLDPAERAVMKEAKLTERFAKMDTNGDGQISITEFKAANAQMGHRHGHGGKGGKGHRKGGRKDGPTGGDE